MCWHKWSKWEEKKYQVVSKLVDKKKEPIRLQESRQRRICFKCGYIEEEAL